MQRDSLGRFKDIKGENHPNWKGKILRGRYYYIKTFGHPNGGKQNYVAEHRLVMESFLNRYLLKTEVVHHINKDTLDNRIENLEVYSSSGEHTKIAHPEIRELQKILFKGKKPINYNKVEHVCLNCKNTFMANKNRKRKFCSHKCYALSKLKMVPTEKQLNALNEGRKKRII